MFCSLEQLPLDHSGSLQSKFLLQLFYTLLSLAEGLVPVEDFINIPELITTFCIKKQPQNADLPDCLMSLTMFVFDSLLEVRNCNFVFIVNLNCVQNVAVMEFLV